MKRKFSKTQTLKEVIDELKEFGCEEIIRIMPVGDEVEVWWR